MAQPKSANVDQKTQASEGGGQQTGRGEAREEGREAMGGGSNDRSEGRSAGSAMATNLAATALRGFGQLFDLQAAATRIVLRAQLRAAAAVGLPDYSRMLTVDDDRTLRLFSTTTDNAVRLANQAEDARGEIQGHLLRLLERQVIDFSEQWQYGLDELQQQATESMEDLKALSRQQAEEMARATESLTEATRETLREGGEQFRATVRQGIERTREIAERQTEALQEEAERTGEAMRGVAHRAGSEMTEATERSGRRSA
ncbi:hypothetical protein [Azoarcus sp. KH32C]|uniref:hypothetical protein n=1 Tax=Azoarcus sp. KH32C TaxID=748247 RepID=UPI0002386DC4|nr:hypothetical protein [Azoarcus sp. KH32C]BAL24952.1 hypothetical protein AZKH_2646 [Azoarcus sp. KH32C]